MSVVTVQRSFPPGQIQSGDPVSRDRGIFRDVQVRVIGYAAQWCGALSRRRCGGICAALLSCCPVVVADVSVISCCRVFTGFCVVAEPSRRIRKLALLSSGGAAGATCPVPPCCSGRYPVALALLRLYRWTYRDRYAAGNRFCSSAGLCPVSFLP